MAQPGRRTLHGPRFGPGAGEARQLVILCHGVGADGHDLIDLAPVWSKAVPHAAFVAPDGPKPYDQARSGRQWFSLADRTPTRMIAGVQAAAPILARFIDEELARLSLPADAVALMGFSQGAMMVLQVGLARSVPPRAVLAFSGALLVPGAIANRAPVLLVHGARDEVVPVERTYQAEQALRDAGVPVETHISPELGHGIDDVGLSAGALFLQRAFPD
jgi:phospholipase/carboxylesterase